MAKSQLGKKDIFAPVKAEKRKATQPEKQTNRQPEKKRSRKVDNQTSREVEKWRKGKRQVSLWLMEDLIERVKIRAHRERKRISQTVQEVLERHI